MPGLLSIYGSPRGNVELLLELVQRSLGFGMEARRRVAPGFADRLADVGVPLAQIGGRR